MVRSSSHIPIPHHPRVLRTAFTAAQLNGWGFGELTSPLSAVSCLAYLLSALFAILLSAISRVSPPIPPRTIQYGFLTLSMVHPGLDTSIISPFGYQKVFHNVLTLPTSHLVGTNLPSMPHVDPSLLYFSRTACATPTRIRIPIYPRFAISSLSRPSTAPLAPCLSVPPCCTGSTRKTVYQNLLSSSPSPFACPFPCLHMYKIKP